jgi:hypothetical protein
MKKTFLAIAMAVALAPLTFAQATTPAAPADQKPAETPKTAAKKNRKHKKAPKTPAATPAATPSTTSNPTK